jgi:hypothetical protein
VVIGWEGLVGELVGSRNFGLWLSIKSIDDKIVIVLLFLLLIIASLHIHS